MTEDFKYFKKETIDLVNDSNALRLAMALFITSIESGKDRFNFDRKKWGFTTYTFLQSIKKLEKLNIASREFYPNRTIIVLKEDNPLEITLKKLQKSKTVTRGLNNSHTLNDNLYGVESLNGVSTDTLSGLNESLVASEIIQYPKDNSLRHTNNLGGVKDKEKMVLSSKVNINKLNTKNPNEVNINNGYNDIHQLQQHVLTKENINNNSLSLTLSHLGKSNKSGKSQLLAGAEREKVLNKSLGSMDRLKAVIEYLSIGGSTSDSEVLSVALDIFIKHHPAKTKSLGYRKKIRNDWKYDSEGALDTIRSLYEELLRKTPRLVSFKEEKPVKEENNGYQKIDDIKKNDPELYDSLVKQAEVDLFRRTGIERKIDKNSVHPMIKGIMVDIVNKGGENLSETLRSRTKSGGNLNANGRELDLDEFKKDITELHPAFGTPVAINKAIELLNECSDFAEDWRMVKKNCKYAREVLVELYFEHCKEVIANVN